MPSRRARSGSIANFSAPKDQPTLPLGDLEETLIEGDSPQLEGISINDLRKNLNELNNQIEAKLRERKEAAARLESLQAELEKASSARDEAQQRTAEVARQQHEGHTEQQGERQCGQEGAQHDLVLELHGPGFFRAGQPMVRVAG